MCPYFNLSVGSMLSSVLNGNEFDTKSAYWLSTDSSLMDIWLRAIILRKRTGMLSNGFITLVWSYLNILLLVKYLLELFKCRYFNSNIK